MDRSLDRSVWRRLLSSQGSAREVEPIGDYVGGGGGGMYTHVHICTYVGMYTYTTF